MKIRKQELGIWVYRLIDGNIDNWVTITFLLKKYKEAGLTEKQLYDRLWRSSKGLSVSLRSVLDCASTPAGQGAGRKLKRKTKKGFVPFETKLGILGL